VSKRAQLKKRGPYAGYRAAPLSKRSLCILVNRRREKRKIIKQKISM